MNAPKKSRAAQYLVGKRRKTILIASGVFVLGAVALGAAISSLFGGGEITVTKEEALAALQNPEQIQQLPPEKRKQALKAYGKAITADVTARGPRPDPALREMEQKLAPEDRRALHQGMRQNMHKAMQQKIADFFKATPQEQEKLIAEEVARMNEMRAKHEADQKAGKDGPGGPGGGRPPREEQPREKREEHLRNMLANTTPTERAQMQEYFRRVHAAAGKK